MPAAIMSFFILWLTLDADFQNTWAAVFEAMRYMNSCHSTADCKGQKK